jgi:hypothetical protein
MAYANEMAIACVPFSVDLFKVAKAAAIKLFGYLPIFPSIGIGCHCIPVNAISCQLATSPFSSKHTRDYPHVPQELLAGCLHRY